MNTPLGLIEVTEHVAAKPLLRYASAPEIRKYIRDEIAKCQTRLSPAASERQRALEDVLSFIRTGTMRERW